MIQRSHERLSTSRTSQLVRKIGSQNQSMYNVYKYRRFLFTNRVSCSVHLRSLESGEGDFSLKSLKSLRCSTRLGDLQHVPSKMRLVMIVKIKILNGGEILVNCKTKITIWICTGRYRGIQIQSKFQFEFVPQDTGEYEFSDFDQLTKISPPFRISICISIVIPSLIFHGTGCSTYWWAFISGFTKILQYHKFWCFNKKLPDNISILWRHFHFENVKNFSR